LFGGGGGVALFSGPVRFLSSIGGNDCLLGFELIIEYEGCGDVVFERCGGGGGGINVLLGSLPAYIDNTKP
jgi:hypothetical protein